MLLFLYDKLMTKHEQECANLDLEFIAFGQISAKMYWLNDTKRKRVFAMVPPIKTTSLVYGGIFLLKDYEHNRYKLHAYYNNSMPYTDCTLIEDLYEMRTVNVIPISFGSLKDLESGKYKKGNPVECFAFFGNPVNKQIQYNAARRYYKLKGVDKDSFIKLIREQVNER